jgi:hypothetical protein
MFTTLFAAVLRSARRLDQQVNLALNFTSTNARKSPSKRRSRARAFKLFPPPRQRLHPPMVLNHCRRHLHSHSRRGPPPTPPQPLPAMPWLRVSLYAFAHASAAIPQPSLPPPPPPTPSQPSSLLYTPQQPSPRARTPSSPFSRCRRRPQRRTSCPPRRGPGADLGVGGTYLSRLWRRQPVRPPRKGRR